MIINGYEQYKELKSRMDRERYVLTPIHRDVYYHPAENSLLCVGIMFEDSTNYTLSITHDDAQQFDLPTISTTAYTPNRKIIQNATDIESLAYVSGQTIKNLTDFLTTYVHETHTLFGRLTDSNKIIPIAVWHDVLRAYNHYLWEIIHQFDRQNDVALSYMHQLVDVLGDIESEGLRVNQTILHENYEDRVVRSFRGDIVYTEYNPYTITGRPSNRFGGINFSALNKSDGTRDMFISRYPEGELIQIDFEAYHLRLMAKELGVYLPTDRSIHTELAQKYFQTDQITDELYAESKKRTFEIMYGMRDDTYGIPLFEKIKELRQSYEYRDALTLPSGITVTVSEPSANKLFNYYVQSLEVVRTLPKLSKVLERLHGSANHLILYTYDSILLDMETFDAQLIGETVSILDENKTFPVRVYRGKTYGSIEEIKM